MLTPTKLTILFLLGHITDLVLGSNSIPPLVITPDASLEKVPEELLSQFTTQPSITLEGNTALLTCISRVGENSEEKDPTVIWKFKSKILTAGEKRVTRDKRFTVLHDDGGIVYVLQIENVSHNDTGLYICEINSDPVVKTFHALQVIQLTHVNEDENKEEGKNASTEGDEERFKSCCSNKSVGKKCQPFCSLNNILEGKVAIDPDQCEPQFPDIVECMADYRNHMPCCIQAGIPEPCRDMCTGQYTVQTDDARTRFNCAPYTLKTLHCLAEGKKQIPGRPEELQAISISKSSITLEWNLPEYDIGVDAFKIFYNKIGTLSEFEIEMKKLDENDWKLKVFKPENQPTGQLHTYKFTLDNLQPFSLYNISVISTNAFGESMSSYFIQPITLTNNSRSDQSHWDSLNPTGVHPLDVLKPPQLDIKPCCRRKNVTDERCINAFCDHDTIHETSLTDLVRCAPFTPDMFHCLLNDEDHTECCKSQQVPEVCHEICDGSVEKITSQHFRCIYYLKHLSRCSLRSMGLLPGPPSNFRFSNIGSTMGILHWDTPAKSPETITHYIIVVKRMNTFFINDERDIIAKRNIHVITDLMPDSNYEVYVEAVNQYGASDSSTRIVFRTSPALTDRDETDQDALDIYDQSECCLKVGVLKKCMPLCRYNVSMSDINNLTTTSDAGGDIPCDSSQLVKVGRCVSGTANHLPCCKRRGVPSRCQSLCQGFQISKEVSLFENCLPWIGSLLTCMEEGSMHLPQAVTDFSAVYVSNTSVSLLWKGSEEQESSESPDDVQYEVYYKKTQPDSISVNPFANYTMYGSGGTKAMIDNLETNQLYQFFVIARNSIGTSIPSSIISLNVSSVWWDGKHIQSSTSPPHGLEVISSTYDSMEVAWTAPVISNPSDSFKYRLHYTKYTHTKADDNKSGRVNETIIETEGTSVVIKGLAPNSQYLLYVVAMNQKTTGSMRSIKSKSSKSEEIVSSPPSETLIAWTELSAQAESLPPVVVPPFGIRKGGSLTILCRAHGTPTPNITLYLWGMKKKEVIGGNKLSYTVQSLVDDTVAIVCMAENGHGSISETQRVVMVESKPVVTLNLNKSEMFVKEDDSDSLVVPNGVEGLVVQFRIYAYPISRISIDRKGKLNGDFSRIKVDLQHQFHSKHVTIATMNFSRIQSYDSGTYECEVNNTLGTHSAQFKLEVIDRRDELSKGDISMSDCCKKHNISTECQGLCRMSFDADYFVSAATHCEKEFSLLMYCATDGSDHRNCCRRENLPVPCLNWCRGVTDPAGQFCALTHVDRIADCFEEGKRDLPSPPINVRVLVNGARTAEATWEMPERNSDLVEVYRVMWRKQHARKLKFIDTQQTSVIFKNLEPGVAYEMVVKAGNKNGTSHITKPLIFVASDDTFGNEFNDRSFLTGKAGQAMSVGLLTFLVITTIVISIILIFVIYIYFTSRRRNDTMDGVSSSNNSSYCCAKLFSDNTCSTKLLFYNNIFSGFCCCCSSSTSDTQNLVLNDIEDDESMNQRQVKDSQAEQQRNQPVMKNGGSAIAGSPNISSVQTSPPFSSSVMEKARKVGEAFSPSRVLISASSLIKNVSSSTSSSNTSSSSDGFSRF